MGEAGFAAAVLSVFWILSWLCVVVVVAALRGPLGTVKALWLGWLLGWSFNIAGLAIAGHLVTD